MLLLTEVWRGRTHATLALKAQQVKSQCTQYTLCGAVTLTWNDASSKVTPWVPWEMVWWKSLRWTTDSVLSTAR